MLGMTNSLAGDEGPKVEIVSWASGTDEQILAMVNAADRGIINLLDYWSIGDTRPVHLNAMSATGVGESHVAQDVDFVLMENWLAGMTPVDPSKPLHFAVGMKSCLKEKGYIGAGSIGGWNDSPRRTWCNNVFANSLPSEFKQCFREFKWKLGTKSGTTSGLTESTDLFALACCKQIYGSGGHTDEAELYNQWRWYMIGNNRIKQVNGTDDTWITSSPHSQSNYFCSIDDTGTYYSYGGISSNYGISPFGCI